ncbi:hypothetical protein [Butyrivibrio sp. YAB3001]|uniref:hypothetical protein n=1 Tax=Butyrivibrio sp. YAB3001 TaxID=1520812 RepID=UPI0008F6498B|nr:hypothetical protein [Butyrivibrio sp. YAB3001]SFB82308.1 hypothetical protein SAMN02910398_00752 [Butyrivibrio sp. YAB3001]
MSRYSVNTDELISAADKCDEIKQEMNDLLGQIRTIQNNLSSDIKRYGGVNAALDNCCSNINKCWNKVDRYGIHGRFIANKYMIAEESVIRNISKGKFEQGFQNGQNDKGNWLQNWISDLIKTLPTIMGKIFPRIGTIIGLPGWITNFDEILAGIGKGIIASGARTTGWSSILGDMWELVTGENSDGGNERNNSDSSLMQDSKKEDEKIENDYETDEQFNKRIEDELRERYSRLKDGNGGKSFKGKCSSFTYRQLKDRGIIDNEPGVPLGKDYYDVYSKMTETSTGYSVEAIGGKNALSELIENHNGENLSNIVVSFNKDGKIFNSDAGHVLMISEIRDGYIYFMDSSDTYWGALSGNAAKKEGEMIKLTLEEFYKTFPKNAINGVVCFSK